MGDLIAFSGGSGKGEEKTPSYACQINFNAVKFIQELEKENIKVWFKDGTTINIKGVSFREYQNELLTRTSQGGQTLKIVFSVPFLNFFKNLFSRKSK